MKVCAYDTTTSNLLTIKKTTKWKNNLTLKKKYKLYITWTITETNKASRLYDALVLKFVCPLRNGNKKFTDLTNSKPMPCLMVGLFKKN